MRTSIPKLHSIKWKNGALAPNVVTIKKGPPASAHVDDILKGAFEAGLYEIVLLGYQQDGSEYIASTTPNYQRAAFMFARGHLFMLQYAENQEE